MDDKTIIFDMDGILFDTERLYMEVWREVAEDKGIENVEEAVQGCVGLNYTDTRLFFTRLYGEEFPFREYMQESFRRVQDRIQEQGLPVKEGVYELLSWLKEEGYAIGLASSTAGETVHKHLESARISAYFQAVVGGDMVEHSKPSPDIYLMACDKLGAQPAETYAIEDSPNGIRSAYAAGMKVIMVPDMIAPDAEIKGMLYRKLDSLTDVLTMLKLQKAVRITLEGAANTRDLGGYRTTDGRRIKPHRLIRSGALAGTTPEDLVKLTEEYQLKTIVDFRTEAERAGKPDPEIPGVRAVIHPILKEETMGITRESGGGAIEGRDLIAQVVGALGTGQGGPLLYMQAMYGNLIREPYSRAQYRAFFDLLLEQEDGAILWHCSAGKDRVGVGSALLLSALGVSRDQIIADYMSTNEFGRKETEAIMERITGHLDVTTPDGKAAVTAIRLLFAVEEEYINSVFEVMEKECGSVEAFLEQEMGLTQEKLDRLRGMYLTEVEQ